MAHSENDAAVDVAWKVGRESNGGKALRVRL